jgi:hypothetical protein
VATLSLSTPYEAGHAPTPADLAALADRLEHVLAGREPQKAKALLRLSIEDRLPRVEADSDRERKRRTRVRLPAKALLQLDGGPERLPGRTEDAGRLVAAKLDHLPAGGENRLA